MNTESSPAAYTRALLHIARNVAPMTLALTVYGTDANRDYLTEKSAHIRRDFLGWLCSLDATRSASFSAFVESCAALADE